MTKIYVDPPPGFSDGGQKIWTYFVKNNYHQGWEFCYVFLIINESRNCRALKNTACSIVKRLHKGVTKIYVDLPSPPPGFRKFSSRKKSLPPKTDRKLYTPNWFRKKVFTPLNGLRKKVFTPQTDCEKKSLPPQTDCEKKSLPPPISLAFYFFWAKYLLN